MRTAPLFFAFVIASCAQPSAPVGNPIVSELAGRFAGAPQSCVPMERNSNLTAIDPSTLTYRFGNTIYVNHPESPCPGIGPFNTLIVEAYQSHYCRGDRVRGLEPGAAIPGPACVLGEWVPYRKP